jgi:hypothetical protein
VNEPVAQSYDLGPGNFWMPGTLFFRDSAGSFSYDLEQPYKCQLQQPILI